MVVPRSKNRTAMLITRLYFIGVASKPMSHLPLTGHSRHPYLYRLCTWVSVHYGSHTRSKMLIPFHLEELKLWNWRGFVAVGFCLLKSLEANTWPDTGRLFNLIRACERGAKGERETQSG